MLLEIFPVVGVWIFSGTAHSGIVMWITYNYCIIAYFQTLCVSSGKSYMYAKSHSEFSFQLGFFP